MNTLNDLPFKNENELVRFVMQELGSIQTLKNEVLELRGELEALKKPNANPKAEKKSSLEQDFIEVRITNILQDLRIPASLKGYHYLREAIMMVYFDMNHLGMMTKHLYPSISKKFETTPSRVERAMRHAIECSYESQENRSSAIYRFTTSRPTVSEFIAAIADRLRLEDAINERR
ncbi:Stage 0 sporulation protein A [Halalkalibacter krulwichiae]|uniref:Stage 0 sporulation protein A n=1 Tax=Halalkalibacter krulwichiae TaxID=199441 RepID=A0A1X9MIQ5_9BACI|nr:sporulation initiation factor Spo0A C-terminal domain-containing protein [Halalkalibacter krulwichiae]ARK32173.1 Stage 0 sporulation protein A [Halalkalibacter krulwichiae]